MCGIAGIKGTLSEVAIASQLKTMCDTIAHRGPDGEGFYIDAATKTGLGHRRLAIIDLTDSGAQPMHFAEKYVITFNGEIYNYIEIREQLKKHGYQFKSESDTEVLLAAYDYWKTGCLKYLDGMFAFAIHDKEKNELFCARDRFGEKPFFYTIYNGAFYFASEIKAFWSVGIPKKTNQRMMYLFLAEDLVENPNDKTETFFEGIFKLDSSSYLLIKDQISLPEQHKYWSIDTKLSNLSLSFESACEQFHSLLHTSVKRRMRSDVKVGCSLSGGLDSSSIVALIMQSDIRLNTISARFPDFSKDEGKYIELVKETFKTDHHDVWIDENDLLTHFEELLYHQDEPFQTGSIFAQYMVYRKARETGAVVMMDGQGADELLGGYDKDFKVWSAEIFRQKAQYRNYLEKLKENHRYDAALTVKEHFLQNFPDIYSGLAGMKRTLSPAIPSGINKDYWSQFKPDNSPFVNQSNLKESLRHQLCNQGLEKLLRFADRNSMASSVEVRLPFLSHELVEFVFSLPSNYFLHNGWSKALLRNSVQHQLPDEIVWRKNKIGFEAPHSGWMKDRKFINRIDEARQRLLKQGIIDSGYSNNWKMIVADHYL